MTLGLKMMFRRDFAAKYIGTTSPHSSLPNKTTFSDSNDSESLFDWCVLGEFDHLSVVPFTELPCVTAVDQAGYQDYTTGAVKQLLLFPCENEQLDTWLAEITASKHFLLTAEISLSPAALEGPNGFASNQNVLGETITIIRESLPENRRIILRSFGAPDYVVLFLPQSLDECVEVADCLDALAESPISKLNCHAQHEGHLFAAIDNTFTFHSELDAAQAGEEHERVSFNFNLSVELGHSAIVRTEIDGKNHGDVTLNSDSIEWNSPQVSGSLKKLSTLLLLCNDIWFDSDFRQANLISTETHFCLKRVNLVPAQQPPVKALHQNSQKSAWYLSQRLYTELIEEISGQIEAFAEQFLEPPQRTELLDTYRLFRCCFFRPGLIGGAKDLLPFFRQLGKALSLRESWESFLERPANATAAQKKDETVLTEFSLLLEYAGRAVRNRIEHKADMHEVPTPYTVENGACKLVGAYSVVIYLCWEIFRRRQGFTPPNGDTRYKCSAENFAACVYFGADGRVTVRELFPQFRTFVEDENKWDGSDDPPFSPQNTTWTARLFALNISGPCLSRPEEMLIHFLHEVAEISEWIEIQRVRKLRNSILSYVSRAVSMSLDYQAREQAKKEEQILSPTSTTFAISAIYASVEIAINTKINFKRLHPEDYAIKLCNSYLEATQRVPVFKKATLATFDRDNKKRLGKSKQPFPIPTHAPSYFSLRGEFREAFKTKCTSLQLFTREIVADIGMVAGFHAIKSATEDPQAVSLEDICKIFSSLLELYEESRSDVVAWVRNAETVVRRWIIHAKAAATADQNWQDSISRSVARLNAQNKLRCMNTDYLQNRIFNSRDRQPATKHLVKELKKYNFYGGSRPANFLYADDFSPPELALLKKFMQVWRSDCDASTAEQRIEFLFDLWAKSLRLRFDQSLSSSEPKGKS